MAKKIVQLENKDGDQIFPISATDIALPGTKVAMRSASDVVSISNDQVTLVSVNVDTPGDYIAIGSANLYAGSNYMQVFIYHNNTQVATQMASIVSDRSADTIIAKITNAQVNDTIYLKAAVAAGTATTQTSDQGLALIKLPEGAPTYKGGALNVTLNAGGTWSGATTLEMSTALRTGKQVVFDGPFFNGGHAILLGFVDSILKSWGVMVNPTDGIMYEIIFDDSNSTWSVRELTDPGYSTYEVKTGQYWTDGKPIYKKTVTKSSTGGTTIAHGISNFGTLVKVEGSAYDSTSQKYIALPSAVSGASTIGVWTVSTTEVACTSTVNDPFTWNVTLYYTKTTD